MASVSRRGALVTRDSGEHLGDEYAAANPPQASTGGEPNARNISRSSSSTVEPGNNGRPQAIS
jgi:hypothetical protein